MSSKRDQKLVIGNWKLQGDLFSNDRLLTELIEHTQRLKTKLAVCVPFPYLAQAQQRLSGTAIAWGAQNLSQHMEGAYTGEVSAHMLNDFSCQYVIVGHSERRHIYGETDPLVSAKFVTAIKAGLIPILCLGETLAQRQANLTIQTLFTQLDAVLETAGVSVFESAVIAYEPVWAIGTGQTATPQQAQEIHALIRERISAKNPSIGRNIQILYGGSIKPQNAKDLFTMPDIDGGLIGAASLVAKDFLAICQVT